MMRQTILAAGCAVALAVATPVAAQRSLFDQPATNAPAAPLTPVQAAPPAAAPAPAAAPEQTEAAPTKPKPRRIARPKGPVPARVLAINNAAGAPLTALEITADGKTARLAKPIKVKGRGSLKLPPFKSCTVTVTSTLEGSQPVDNELDICREKAVRITDG